MRAQSLAPTKKPLLGERWHRVAITERGLIAKHNDSSPLSVAYGDSRPRGASHLPIIFFIIERKSGSMIACVMVNVASQSVICSQATRAVITFVIEAG